jgi:hypothetical protein
MQEVENIQINPELGEYRDTLFGIPLCGRIGVIENVFSEPGTRIYTSHE